MKFASLALGGLALCVTIPTLACGEWTEFRGSSGTGKLHGKILPTRWSATENIVWRTELPGRGWSSPVVSRGVAFVSAAVPTTPENTAFDLVLLRIDVHSGKLLGQTRLFQQGSRAPAIHKKNSHASPTPIIEGERVYVHFGHQGTACVSTSGDVLWRNDSLAYAPVHGNGGSPVIVDDLLIFSRDGRDLSVVTALYKQTGELAWQTERQVEAAKRFSFCTPLVMEQDGRRQLILPGSNIVQSLDPATGAEHWRLRYDGYSVIPRPIFESGLVFVCTGYNRPSILAIDPTGVGDVTDSHLQWRSNSNIPHTPSLLGIDGRIAMISDKGIAMAFDARTGREIWKKRVGGNYSASPLLVGQHMYVLSESGVCTIYDVSGEPKEIAKNTIDERTLASFAVIQKDSSENSPRCDLLLRTDKALYRIASTE